MSAFTSREIAASTLVGESGYTIVCEVAGQRLEQVVEETVQVSPNLIMFYVEGTQWAWALHPEDMVEVLYN